MRGARQGLARALLAAAALAPCAAPAQTPPPDPSCEQSREATEAGQWSQAELLLERCLMLDPDNAAARLDLAVLLSQRGALEAASALILSLIDDPRTPPAHRERLQQLLAQTQEAVGAAADPTRPRVYQRPPARLATQVSLGYAQNPLARADLAQLTLTFPEGRVRLPVSQTVQPGWLLGMGVARTEPGQWGVEASLLQLTGPEADLGGRLAVYGLFPWQPAPDTGRLEWQAQFQRAFGGADRSSTGLSWWSGPWRLAASGFREAYLGRTGATLRLERSLQPTDTLRLLPYLEAERADNAPPPFVRAGILAGWEVAPGWQLLAHLARQRDTSGYSPLLEDSARRQLTTAVAMLERAWQPTDADWRLVLRAHVGRRSSNLELFSYHDAGLELAFQQRWR